MAVADRELTRGELEAERARLMEIVGSEKWQPCTRSDWKSKAGWL